MRDPEHQFFPNGKIQVITQNENIETIKKELHDEREKASLSILDELNQIANKMKPKNAEKQGNENDLMYCKFKVGHAKEDRRVSYNHWCQNLTS